MQFRKKGGAGLDDSGPSYDTVGGQRDTHRPPERVQRPRSWPSMDLMAVSSVLAARGATSPGSRAGATSCVTAMSSAQTPPPTLPWPLRTRATVATGRATSQVPSSEIATVLTLSGSLADKILRRICVVQVPAVPARADHGIQVSVAHGEVAKPSCGALHGFPGEKLMKIGIANSSLPKTIAHEAAMLPPCLLMAAAKSSRSPRSASS